MQLNRLALPLLHISQVIKRKNRVRDIYKNSYKTVFSTPCLSQVNVDKAYRISPRLIEKTFHFVCHQKWESDRLFITFPVTKIPMDSEIWFVFFLLGPNFLLLLAIVRAYVIVIVIRLGQDSGRSTCQGSIKVVKFHYIICLSVYVRIWTIPRNSLMSA